jgi:hypothetical protein
MLAERVAFTFSSFALLCPARLGVRELVWFRRGLVRLDRQVRYCFRFFGGLVELCSSVDEIMPYCIVKSRVVVDVGGREVRWLHLHSRSFLVLNLKQSPQSSLS